MTTLPVLITTPHSSGHIPHDILADMLGETRFDHARRRKRLQRIFDGGDPYTDIIFHVEGTQQIHALTSRFVVDLNRSRDYSGANGVIKLTDFNGRSLYPDDFELGDVQKERRLVRYWDSFHQSIEHNFDNHGIQLMITGHSMSAFGPAIGPDPHQVRPGLTLMTGGDEQGEVNSNAHTSLPGEVARTFVKLLEHHFKDIFASSPEVASAVTINNPWGSDNIAQRYSHPERDNPVMAFGLEINRDLYLETVNGVEKAIDGRLEELNQAFTAFLHEGLEVLS